MISSGFSDRLSYSSSNTGNSSNNTGSVVKKEVDFVSNYPPRVFQCDPFRHLPFNVAVFQPKRTGNAFLGCIVYFYLSSLCTNKLAALIFFIACCCLLFGKVTFREAAAMFAGSFCVFVLPYAAERILERISDLNRCVKDWVRG